MNSNQSRPLLKINYIVIYDNSDNNSVNNYSYARIIVGIISLIILIVVTIVVVKQYS